jgi:hypothetical protein
VHMEPETLVAATPVGAVTATPNIKQNYFC